MRFPSYACSQRSNPLELEIPRRRLNLDECAAYEADIAASVEGMVHTVAHDGSLAVRQVAYRAPGVDVAHNVVPGSMALAAFAEHMDAS